MIKKIFKIIIILGIIVGICYGISITGKKNKSFNTTQVENSLFEMMQTRPAELVNFYTYGKSFGFTGKLTNISKDNFENIKLYITDGNDFTISDNMDVEFSENDLIFSVKEINNTLLLDKIDSSLNYYILVRLKLNNSANPRYYSFANNTQYENIDYYEKKDDKTYKGNVSFKSGNSKGKTYSLMYVSLEESEIPGDVYDVVIDAGHGGKDKGEVRGRYVESDITLKYAKEMKNALETRGYKVAMTRDDSNTDMYTAANMYDADGRISLACKSRAKLMISFHVNNDALPNLNGFEIYCPCKSNLDFASNMADKIKELCTINYSNNNTNKIRDGVYVRNYSSDNIRDANAAAKRKGYEPYPLTPNTPFLYTIREVGGVATQAYVDGRNTDYSKNAFYNSNHGIECYQIELGYIKNDMEIVNEQIQTYVEAIAQAIENHW